MKDYTPSLSELEARLEKLERQNRRLKGLGLGFLLIVLSGLLLARTLHKPAHAAPASAASVTYDTLVVHRLELHDEAGKLRGDWIVKNGVPSLSLYDAAGRPRAELGVFGGFSSLSLTGAAGKTSVVLFANDGRPCLLMCDAADEVRALLGVSGEGPSLQFYDAAGKGGVDINQNSLSVTDARGFESVVGVTGLEKPATGETRTSSAAAVTLFGKGRKVIWHAP
jgi:hypothetical protein